MVKGHGWAKPTPQRAFHPWEQRFLSSLNPNTTPSAKAASPAGKRPWKKTFFSFFLQLEQDFSGWIFSVILPCADVIRYHHLVWLWNGNTSAGHNQVIFPFLSPSDFLFFFFSPKWFSLLVHSLCLYLVWMTGKHPNNKNTLESLSPCFWYWYKSKDFQQHPVLPYLFPRVPSCLLDKETQNGKICT